MSNSTIWNFWAKRYENLWVQKVSLAPTRVKVIEELKEIITERDKVYRILDIGCGTGQLILDIKRSFNEFDLEIHGIDFSEKMIESAKENLKAGEVFSKENTKIKEICDDESLLNVMDTVDLNKIHKKFHIITCTHSFPYYKIQKKVLMDMGGLLDENGTLIIANASENTAYDKVAMKLVKLTTGKATYPSIEKMNSMKPKTLILKNIIKIKERFFMPSIILFRWKKV